MDVTVRFPNTILVQLTCLRSHICKRPVSIVVEKKVGAVLVGTEYIWKGLAEYGPHHDPTSSYSSSQGQPHLPYAMCKSFLLFQPIPLCRHATVSADTNYYYYYTLQTLYSHIAPHCSAQFNTLEAMIKLRMFNAYIFKCCEHFLCNAFT